ncbi:diguanylate cyclase CdgB [Streptomyces sp. MBT62]|uniref:diguanylate cyclase CdgB n=1 Tax=Streptomyces sp. MBT62 TaxID=2800410 RepID=UPI00190A8256|nr:diguanylate cyclase CdgB [Streptomyces sp. MBT62]MBK3570707.1 diguanylate cyclase [Streptomyces sp. MBT62]
MADMNTARSLADTLQTVADGVANALGYELACVNLVRPDGDLVVAAFAGNSATEALITGRVGSRTSWERRLGMGERWGDLVFIPYIEGRVLDDDVPQWHTDGPAPRFEDQWHPSDRLLAPMYTPSPQGSDCSDGELIGVLSVDRPRNGRRPGAWGREALQMYAFQAGIAIRNARLRANMQRALERLEREQQALRASEESFQRSFEYSPSGIAIAEIGGDQHGRILRTNDALCRLLGRPASAMRRYSFSDLVHSEDIDTLLKTTSEGGHAEVRLCRRDGTYIWVSLRSNLVADAADGPRLLLTHVEDIEERKRRELQHPHHGASHDPLTGLPNSAELRIRLSTRLCLHGEPERMLSETGSASDASDQHVHVSAPEGERDDGTKGLAVLFCRLDGLKSINDRFGRNVGDAVLVEVAGRLSGGVRDGDTVARLGDDKFVVLADGLGRADAADLAARLRGVIIQPIRVDGRAMRVGARFGIGWAHCGMTADEVLKSADEQMHVDERSRPHRHRQVS